MTKNKQNPLKVVTRFAPSPTGDLHIGGARTALYNFLFARHYDGKFYLRIDNTDTNRNQDDSLNKILCLLHYLKINHDNQRDLYFQLDHLNSYHKFINKLIDSKNAYYCFCSPEDLQASLEKQKKSNVASPKYNYACRNLKEDAVALKLKEGCSKVVRFKMPFEKTFCFEDLIRGKIEIKGREVEDFVILKSNNIPTYNLANVYDDYHLKVTHVIRGSEHLYNTPKQMAIYDAVNWNYPTYAHLSLILGEDNKKMSKRSNNPLFFIENFRQQGFISAAVNNALALLGWTPDKTKEIFAVEELINLFDGTKLNNAPCHFSADKVFWINQQHLQSSGWYSIQHECLKPLKVKYPQLAEEKLIEILDFFAGQLRVYEDIVPLSEQIINQYYLGEKLVSVSAADKAILLQLQTVINNIEAWEEEIIKKHLIQFCKNENVARKTVFLLLRKIISNQEHGPAIFFMLKFWGAKKLNYLISQLLSHDEK